MIKEQDCKSALLLAAGALEIASDWGLRDIQLSTPSDVELKPLSSVRSTKIDYGNSWYSIMDIVKMLRELAKNFD